MISPSRHCDPVHRIGAVCFLNTRPLICGLAQAPGVHLERAVPAELAQRLAAGRVDAALAPSVDYQRARDHWLVAPGAVIASCDEVLTVRVFSRMPLERVERIACDTDSHTSVVLVQVIWRLCFDRVLTVEPLCGDAENHDAVLLIGDKVIGQLGLWPVEFDLGRAWSQATGLPFVYAFWSIRPRDPGLDGELARLLLAARQRGEKQLDAVADRYAHEHGFTPDLARVYFRDNLCLAPDEDCWQGLARFYELAHEFDLLPRLRPLRFVGAAEQVEP